MASYLQAESAGPLFRIAPHVELTGAHEAKRVELPFLGTDYILLVQVGGHAAEKFHFHDEDHSAFFFSRKLLQTISAAPLQ